MTDALGAAPPPAGAPLALEEQGLLAPVYPLPRLELTAGRGARVVDAAGREYLDFASGIAVNAFGHAPAGLPAAIARQMRKLVHCSNLFANRPAIELARALTAATGYDLVFFCNSGTEAVEAALKFARVRARHRGSEARDIVAFRGGFHGRTAFALSTTWTPSYREPFEPLMPAVRFGDFNRLDGLDPLIDERVAAVVIEPVQGEGGVIPATREFLAAVRDRAAAAGAALILDEIQCGMGRCGRLLAAEHYGVRGDFTVLSKALGGGLPLAAVLMTADAGAGLASGMHGCTFGGGPVVTTAGAWVLDRINRPRFLGRVRRRGAELVAGLEALVARRPLLASARGMGLLTAVELAADAPVEAPAVVRAARDHGLLVVRGGERAVRLIPPLTVSVAEIHEGLQRFERALASIASTKGPAE